MADSSKKGDVTYEIRADDSNVESDLEQANRKVEKAAKQSANDTVKIEEKKTSSIKSESNKVVKSAQDAAGSVTESWKKSGEESSSFFGNLKDTLTDTFTSAADSSIPLVGEVGDLTKGLSGAQVAAIGAGAAAVGVGAVAVGVANDVKGAMNEYLSLTGKSTEEAERYQAVMENIYNANYGENFSDIAQTMAEVNHQLGEMDDASLQNITEAAFTLRDTFGYDVTESTRAAKAMVDNFGVSGEEAMNLIAAGAQNGLDFSGELIDSISEYSVHFSKVGFDAEDMFKIFQVGAESGAFNLDKVGDAIKEMSIRVMDGSDTTKEGFEAIGLNADDMAAKFAAGGDSAKEAFQQTIGALAELEDPLEQNAAGVNLFGTMWEDLGADAVTALAQIQDETYATGDEMKNLQDIKYDDLNSQFETLKRNVETALIPIGEALMPILSDLAEAVLPLLTEVLAPLLELVAQFLTPILDLIIQGLKPLIDAFMQLIDEAIMPVVEVLASILFPIFESVFGGIFSDVSDVIGNVVGILTNLVDFIKNVLTGNWEDAWENIKDIFENIVSGLGTIFKRPINFIIDGINGFIDGINGIKIPDWVPIVGGKSFKIDKIPRLKVGMDYVPSDKFPAFLDEGEWVLTKEEASLLRSFGGLDGVMAQMGASGKIDNAFCNTQTDLVDEQSIKKLLNVADKLSKLADRPIVVATTVDGKVIAKATAEPMQEELTRNSNFKNMLKGVRN